jgi:hypothetical protein
VNPLKIKIPSKICVKNQQIQQFVGFSRVLTKFTVQVAKFPVKISSDSVAWRDLIPALKG